MTMNNNKYPHATPVYAALETEESEDSSSSRRAVAATDLGASYFTVSQAYQHLPEARDLTWTDDFFEDDDDIVAVFDMDYDSMETFYTSLGWVGIGLTLLYPPLFMIASVALMPCYLKRNVTWSVRAKHVAITRDGIRVVDNKRQCGWGLACMDIGKKSKTVPFDKITDCDIVEPAGNECICVPRILFKVHIDTASSNKEHHELVLAGLRDPHAFKKLVWAMKRAQQQNQLPATASSPPPGVNSIQMTMRGGTSMMPSVIAAAAAADNNNNNADIANLLREIRDELRQNNETLQAMKNSQVGGAGGSPAVASSAPIEEEARFV